ncbi:MAG: glycosyltransferase family 4 protein [Candidatus Gorgyraea atricola]|nr:glycosyltransferase family 4 protein [Candidatus Gorgyraea atricola]
MKILFIEPYPTEGPSSRYRVEQYLPYFKKEGIECILRPFVSTEFYRILYKKGFYLRKTLFFMQGTLKRFFDILTAVKCDIIFIHLEAFPFGPPVFEWILSKMGKRVIYDLDDAIYMGIPSSANRFLRRLKCPSKISTILRMSSFVITCNDYLADYAKKYNKNVITIHTSVDTEEFKPGAKEKGRDMTIGWIGSHSTARYLEGLKRIFLNLGSKYKFNLKIIGAGDHDVKIDGVNVMNIEWNLKDDIKQFQSLDIGVYPLPEDEWIQGKTGFKAIQYMSVGVPCVASDVGANRSIVKDGINGYLAKTEDEWIEKLSMLVDSPELRQRIGSAGRITAEKEFSVKANAPRYLEIIKRISP